jgi:hypothetical protein
MCYYGNGYTFKDVYKMPVHIRMFHFKKLVDAKKGEKKQQEDSMKKTSTRKPNVRVRK